ncbi:MAG TPA: hypothetical protein PKC28_12695 [Bdellovibrionales bacterium]|nr:hypothetical protein [Bdellovibrionales bacterium]
MTFMLTQFQNCAPAGSLPEASAVGGGGDGEIRIVDDMNKTEIQFAAESVQIHDEAPATGVQGLCNRVHNGAHLRWAVWAGRRNMAPLAAGDSLCQGGQFNVQMDQLDSLVCGVQHLLVVEGDWGGSTFTHVTRRCQPLVSEEIAVPDGAPMGTSCSLEYQPAVDAENRCVQICYRDNKVVASRGVEVSQCNSLRSKLAGP